MTGEVDMHMKRMILLLIPLFFLVPMIGFAGRKAWKEAMSKSRAHLDGERWQEAISAAKEAVRITHRSFGPASPQMADTLLLLSDIFVRQQMFEKAEPLQRQSLDIMEKRLGRNHPDLVKYLNPLVVTCVRQDRYEAAEHFHT